MGRPTLTATAALAVVALLLATASAATAPPPSAAERPSSALAADLARLRGETEQLAATLEGDKDALRATLRSLAAQRVDLEIELRREEVRLDQLREGAVKRREAVAAESAAREALTPAVRAAIDRLHGAIRASLPFHVEERLAEIDRIGTQLDEGLLTPQDALARLWDRVEDELRLSRESGLYQQVVPVEGGEALVDVVRLGMVGLLYRTRAGTHGRAVRTDDGWTFRPFSGETDAARAAALFDAFKKQVRTGFHVLPAGALAWEEGS